MTLPRFGTDGWRAIIAEGFTFDNVRLIARAAARHALSSRRQARPVIAVGHDTRFLSPEFAAAFSQAAAYEGADILLSKGFCPTPALSFAILRRRLALGVMVTASHNPAIYNGLKFKGPHGGPALPAMTAAIESLLDDSPARRGQRSGTPGRIREADFRIDYGRQLAKYVDMDAVAAFPGRIVFNPMGGAGCGTLDSILSAAGLEVITINGDPDPTFGGLCPEPIPQNLKDHAVVIRETGAAIGLCTDGDADRFGVLDDTGEFVQLHDLMPLLFQHLIETRGWSGGAVRTTSMHDTIDRVAAPLGREVVEVPVGFKNVCAVLLAGDYIIGGEESGGFGYKNHMPERDGILSCLLLLEMLSRRGCTIREAVARLRSETGPFAYGRIDQHGDPARLRESFAALRRSPPARIGGAVVTGVSLADGIKFRFKDGSWMLVRLSDTEPLARIYVGSSSKDRMRRILRGGSRILFGK